MKALIFFTVLFIFTAGGVYLFSDPESSAQVPPASVNKPINNIEKEFDARLDRVEDKVTQAEQKKIDAKPKIVIRKVTVIKEVPAEDHKSLLTIGGEQYEVEPLEYKGYNIFNVDSIQNAIAEQEIEKAMYSNDTFSHAMIEEANERINLWQKVKSFFKRKN